MVSTQKIKYYTGRVKQAIDQKYIDVKKKYPEVEVEYRDLITSGKAIMKTEKEIREAVGRTSRYSCPPVVEILEIFKFDGEREEAKKLNEKIFEMRKVQEDKIKLMNKKATDFVYLGTESQLLDMIYQIENMEI